MKSFFCHKSHALFSVIFSLLYIGCSLLLPTKEMQILCTLNIGATGAIIFAPYILKGTDKKKTAISVSLVTLIFSLVLALQVKIGVDVLGANLDFLRGVSSNFAVQSLLIASLSALLAHKTTKCLYSDFQFIRKVTS